MSMTACKAIQPSYWGISTSIDLKNCDPMTIRDADKIRHYVEALCHLIQMNRFGECQVVHFGEDEKVAGFSMVQLIETSLISGHFANATNSAYIDIFSCKDYNAEQAAKFTADYFGVLHGYYALNVTYRM